MRARKVFVVISYDIPDDKRRTRVCKLLKNYGAHVQYSVFECLLKRRDLQELRRRLAKLLSLDQDNVRLYFLCQDDVARIESLGVGSQVAADKAYYLH
jgi:CRISPR-associated protein Cas2